LHILRSLAGQLENEPESYRASGFTRSSNPSADTWQLSGHLIEPKTAHQSRSARMS
jgi:hypothetical protein